MQKIMFNEHYGLQTAVEKGYKKQTRRFVGFPLKVYSGCYLKDASPDEYTISIKEDGLAYYTYDKGEYEVPTRYQPKYKVGEVVAIARSYDEIKKLRPDSIIPYEIGNPGKTNKMYVSASMMIDWIRITGIEAQRIQDLTENDCLEEGVLKDDGILGGYYVPGIERKDRDGSIWTTIFYSPKEAYAALINKLGKKGTWAKNEWCYAYKFEYLKHI